VLEGGDIAEASGIGQFRIVLLPASAWVFAARRCRGSRRGFGDVGEYGEGDIAERVWDGAVADRLLDPLQAGENVDARKLRIFGGEVVGAPDQIDDGAASCEFGDEVRVAGESE
jgi:hypothetical protein